MAQARPTADQFLIRPAGRLEDAAVARPGDESHNHRWLSLVHGLGTRHDDQPRGPDPSDRPHRELDVRFAMPKDGLIQHARRTGAPHMLMQRVVLPGEACDG
jgi:hypothetical protein